MAYYPKNKAKIKPSKYEGEFTYQDDGKSFPPNSLYIQTSKNEFFEGEDINFPGRVLIPTGKNLKKNRFLSLLLDALGQLVNTFLFEQLLNQLLGNLINPGDIQLVEQVQDILNNIGNREITEEEKKQISEILNNIESEEILDFERKNQVVTDSIYNNLKPEIFSKLNSNQSLVPTKIRPTDEDYSKGSYLRYFAVRTNNLGEYFEINKFSYDSIVQEKTVFDINLYRAFIIRWELGANAEQINNNVLNRYEKVLRGIKNLFPNPTEYARVIQSNLFTDGNELFFENGEEYIGEYHINPIQGPMVGAVHIQEPHAKLYYIYELGTPKDESDPLLISSSEQLTGLIETIDNIQYFIRENKFGIFAEAIDTIPDPNNSIYRSRVYLKTEISSRDLLNLAKEEVKKGITLNPPLNQVFTEEESQGSPQPQLNILPTPPSPQPTTFIPTPPSINQGGLGGY